jgi:glycosyltransferase involved in cell wall biosynthesis
MTSLTTVLHVTPFVGKASFGIGPVVLSIATSQRALGLQADIWCYDDKTEISQLQHSYDLGNQAIRSFPIVGPGRLGYSPVMERDIVAQAGSYDVIQQHGIWTGVSRATNCYRAHNGKPTIISPHGSLDTWALRRSIWKKRLARFLYEGKNLHEAACLHALSKREAEGFRAIGLRNPIAVIPNGISETWLLSTGDASAFRRKHGLSEKAKILLFLGRITPIKGLPMLVRALSTLKQRLEDWKLVIAGVDEFSHQKEVQLLVEQLAMKPYVQFVGPLFDHDKRDAFAAADLFVLPSHSEGAPIVILEALESGIPVLATKASPWEDLVTYRCGWWSDISENAIADALEDAIQKPRDMLQEMGQRGKSLVQKRYTWSQVAEKTSLLYEWLLGRKKQPDFVIKD